jgi:hypothetical protein
MHSHSVSIPAPKWLLKMTNDACQGRRHVPIRHTCIINCAGARLVASSVYICAYMGGACFRGCNDARMNIACMCPAHVHSPSTRACLQELTREGLQEKKLNHAEPRKPYARFRWGRMIAVGWAVWTLPSWAPWQRRGLQ